MFIKKYNQFVTESRDEELCDSVDRLMSDEDAARIINKYITEPEKHLTPGNAVNLLDNNSKTSLKKELDDYESMGVVDKEASVEFTTVEPSIEPVIERLDESEITPGGKGAFSSFLKVMTALGQKDVVSDTASCPEGFILYYPSGIMETTVVKSVLSRYKSLSRFVDDVDYSQNELRLYFGVRCDGDIEYGSFADDARPFGSFRLSTSTIKWLSGLDLRAAFSLKKEIVNLSPVDVKLLGKIKSDMMTYEPGYNEEKMSPSLTDRIISFGYKGVGKWDNGVLDQGEMDNIKSNFTSWVMSKSWGDKVLVSIKAGSYWLYIHIKLK